MTCHQNLARILTPRHHNQDISGSYRLQGLFRSETEPLTLRDPVAGQIRHQVVECKAWGLSTFQDGIDDIWGEEGTPENSTYIPFV